MPYLHVYEESETRFTNSYIRPTTLLPSICKFVKLFENFGAFGHMLSLNAISIAKIIAKLRDIIFTKILYFDHFDTEITNTQALEII